MEFQDEIKQFMEKWQYSRTEFGRMAMGDPNFVRLLFDGKRSPTMRTIQKIRSWMAKEGCVSPAARRPPSKTIEWTREMDEQLVYLIDQGFPMIDIGVILHLSHSAARRRAVKIGKWPAWKSRKG